MEVEAAEVEEPDFAQKYLVLSSFLLVSLVLGSQRDLNV